MNKNIMQTIQLSALTIVLMFGGFATAEAFDFGEYGGEGCYDCYSDGSYDYDYIEPSYDYSYSDGSYDYDYIEPAYDYSYSDGSYDYDYIEPDYGSYSNASFVPSYASAYSGSSSSAYATGSGGSFNFSPRINYSPSTKTANKYVYNTPTYVRPSYPTYPTQPIIINPAPAPVASQPINIVNNNVNNNVNTNTVTPAPVAAAPVYYPPYNPPYIYPVPNPTVTPQCAVYATASNHSGANVVLSWATELGDTTDVYCSGGVMSNRRVAAISTATIYPTQSTTCYATVRKVSTGASKTCQVYIPVDHTVNTYVPQYNYTPYIPQYNYGSVVLTSVPYTGAEDYIYPMFLLTIVLTAGYVIFTQRRRILA